MSDHKRAYADFEQDIMSYLNEKIPEVSHVCKHEIAAYLTAQTIIMINDSYDSYIRELKQSRRRG